LIGDRVRDRNEHRVMRRQKLGEAAGGVAGKPGVHACGQPSVKEVVTEAQVAGLACRTLRIYPPGTAGQPRIEDDPLSDFESTSIWTKLNDLGNDLVAEDGRVREECIHGIVPVAFTEILEHVLGIRA